MTTTWHTLLHRVCADSPGDPPARPWTMVVDGVTWTIAAVPCALLAVRAQLPYPAWRECPWIVARAGARLTSLAELRDWLGPVPVATVQPCPDWEAHELDRERLTAGELTALDGTCYYDCARIEGLGYAHETPSRTSDYVRIAGQTYDAVVIARVLDGLPGEDVAIGTIRSGAREQYDALAIQGRDPDDDTVWRVVVAPCGPRATPTREWGR